MKNLFLVLLACYTLFGCSEPTPSAKEVAEKEVPVKKLEELVVGDMANIKLIDNKDGSYDIDLTGLGINDNYIYNKNGHDIAISLNYKYPLDENDQNGPSTDVNINIWKEDDNSYGWHKAGAPYEERNVNSNYFVQQNIRYSELGKPINRVNIELKYFSEPFDYSQGATGGDGLAYDRYKFDSDSTGFFHNGTGPLKLVSIEHVAP